MGQGGLCHVKIPVFPVDDRLLEVREHVDLDRLRHRHLPESDLRTQNPIPLVQTPQQPHLVSNGCTIGFAPSAKPMQRLIGRVGSGLCVLEELRIAKERKELANLQQNNKALPFYHAAEHRLCPGIELRSAKRRLRCPAEQLSTEPILHCASAVVQLGLSLWHPTALHCAGLHLRSTAACAAD